LRNHAIIRGAKVDASVTKFTSATSQIARTVAACLQEDSELARETVLLLQQQDDDLRAQRALDVNCVIAEVLWARVHNQEERDVRVEDLTKDLNALLRSRGERVEHSAEEIGWKLRGLNIRRHTVSSGRHVLFDRETRRRTHQLALAYELPCLAKIQHDCQDCIDVEKTISK
jgi:hypothetical protein